MKRIITLLLAVFLLIPISAKAVATDITTQLANGGVVVLDRDVTIENTITITKDTVIDLHGHELGGPISVGNRHFLVEKGAKLTILDTTGKNHSNDSLKLDVYITGDGDIFAGHFNGAYSAYGALNIYGGDFDCEHDASYAGDAQGIFNGDGVVNIYGGYFSGRLYNESGNINRGMAVRATINIDSCRYSFYGGTFVGYPATTEGLTGSGILQFNTWAKGLPISTAVTFDSGAEYVLSGTKVSPSSLITKGFSNHNFTSYVVAPEGGTLIIKPTQQTTDTINAALKSYTDKYFPNTPSLDNFVSVNTYTADQFADVKSDFWGTQNIAKAYELGLMKGDSDRSFAPEGKVTIAQAVTMAARIHSIYSTGEESFTQDGVWYQTYVDYARDNGIISGTYTNYDASATREQFAAILAAALPANALSSINTVADGAIPDVKMTDENAAAIYALYRAGILTGSDASGTFTPSSTISRAETAAIVTRMADTSLRKNVTL